MNREQLRLLADFCVDVAKGLAVSYFLGTAIAGRPTSLGIAVTLQTMAAVGFLLIISVLLLREVDK